MLKSGKWLCDKNNPHQSAEVEISFSRATIINFIDIGKKIKGKLKKKMLIREAIKTTIFVYHMTSSFKSKLREATRQIQISSQSPF